MRGNPPPPFSVGIAHDEEMSFMTPSPRAFLWSIDPQRAVYGHDEVAAVLHAWRQVPDFPEGSWWSGDWLGIDRLTDRTDPRYRACWQEANAWSPWLFPLRHRPGQRIYVVFCPALSIASQQAIHHRLTPCPTYLGLRSHPDWPAILGSESGQVRAGAIAIPCWIHENPGDLPDASCQPLQSGMDLAPIAPVVAYHPVPIIDPAIWDALFSTDPLD